MACPDPSLGGMSLPRAHPCIAHYRPFTEGTQSDTTFRNGRSGRRTGRRKRRGPQGRGTPGRRLAGGLRAAGGGRYSAKQRPAGDRRAPGRPAEAALTQTGHGGTLGWGLSGAGSGDFPFVPDRLVRPHGGAMRSVALFRRPGAVLVTCSVAVTTVLALGTGGTASAAGRAAAADVAPGAPGAPSYFDLARKDCVGTATGTRSKVWYTVAGG